MVKTNRRGEIKFGAVARVPCRESYNESLFDRWIVAQQSVFIKVLGNVAKTFILFLWVEDLDHSPVSLGHGNGRCSGQPDIGLNIPTFNLQLATGIDWDGGMSNRGGEGSQARNQGKDDPHS